jgi:hypothetical protein
MVSRCAAALEVGATLQAVGARARGSQICEAAISTAAVPFFTGPNIAII